MENTNDRFLPFLWRVMTVHMAAYFAAGILAMTLFNYREFFSSGALAQLMRPFSSPIIAAGPFLQFIMGLALGSILYPFRQVFLAGPKGWLALLLLMAGLSVFSPQVPGPGTFEGLLYTTVPVSQHLLSLPETFMYSLFFSLALTFWCRHPRRLFNILAVVLIVLIAAMSLLGYLAAVGILKA